METAKERYNPSIEKKINNILKKAVTVKINSRDIQGKLIGLDEKDNEANKISYTLSGHLSAVFEELEEAIAYLNNINEKI